jgi:hypothetical protein
MKLIVRRTLERIEKKKGKLYNENYVAERIAPQRTCCLSVRELSPIFIDRQRKIDVKDFLESIKRPHST